ncbi:MAG: PilZ domain-containing protein [Candidatus Omnitrophota bacterium]
MENAENSYAGVERRRYPRLRAAVIEYSFAEKDSPQQSAFTRDVGAGGISIIVNEKIETGTILLLKIYLPSYNDPILTQGRVVWRNPSAFQLPHADRFDLGIEFTEISEEDQQKISEYVLKPLK